MMTTGAPRAARRVRPAHGLTRRDRRGLEEDMFWAIAIPVLALIMVSFGWIAGREKH